MCEECPEMFRVVAVAVAVTCLYVCVDVYDKPHARDEKLPRKVALLLQRPRTRIPPLLP